MSAVAAKIKLTQGATTDIAGNAVFGITGASVVASNDNNTNVKRWTWFLTDVPPGSALVVGTDGTGGTPFAPNQDGSSPTFSFTPDVRGGYAVKLIVWDEDGKVTATHSITFGVKEESNRFIPPFRAVASMLKFAGQLRGWAPYLEEWLRAFDGSMSGAQTIWGFLSSKGKMISDQAPDLVTNNNTITLYTWPFDDLKPTGLDVVVLAWQGSNAARWNLSMTKHRNGGAPIDMGGVLSTLPVGTNGGAPPAGWDATMDISSNSGRVRGTSGGGVDVNWMVFIQALRR